MSDEPENFTLALLRKIDGKVDSLRDEIVEVRAELRSEIHSLRADVASDLMGLEQQIKDTEKRLGDQIVVLRRSVMEYHSSAVGHGMLLSEFDERLRRLEQHVGLAPEAH